MNLQDIITPLAKITEASFAILEGQLPNLVNWGCIVLGLVGLVYWLKLQGRYNKEAKQGGRIA
ncbi:MAG: hypothetical protein ACI84C_000927 [Flavobacteriales bacterium]|jgi:hypothetical protein